MMRVYLACPYSHKNPFIQIFRWLWVSWASYQLMKRGYAVFSPISHSVPISWFQSKKDNCHDFWLKQDDVWLGMCWRMFILGLNGWKHSTGIQYEIKRAKYLGISISVLHPKTLKVMEVLNE